ncbi:hypothetical protein F5Y17DRAFT_413603 [Xylariaceae sp. FL0594]|nr:hypothetical protein F5Y17DRAFT_413603 [Xylariaceae sp. FL0594]
MSPPLPVPSKAALRALRGIALGSSCAIGLIIEVRRQRINTLTTVVENKNKLRASTHYHQTSLEQLACEIDAAVAVGSNIQWDEKGAKLKSRHAERSSDQAIPKVADPPEAQDDATQSLPTQTPVHNLVSSPKNIPFTVKRRISTSPHSRAPVDERTNNPSVDGQSTKSLLFQQDQILTINEIEDLLSRPSVERLEKALSLFTSRYSAQSARDASLFKKWLDVSARLSRVCQAKGLWKEAGEIVNTMAAYRPMDEAQFLDYNPIPIIEFYLHRKDKSSRCPAEAFDAAYRLYVTKLKDRPKASGTGMERVGRRLMLEALTQGQHNIAHKIYWRTFGWADEREPFVRWAVETFFRHKAYKNVIKAFLLQYCYLNPPKEHFSHIIDRIVDSVKEMKGLSATPVLAGLAQMQCPEGAEFATRWFIKLLHAYWERYKDIAKATEFLEKAVSLGILEKTPHPELVHSALVEIAIKAGNEKMAYAYAEEIIGSYPTMKDTLALKLAVIKAKAGDWEGAFQTFAQVQRDALPFPTAYDDAFLVVLKEFAACHSAAETREFAMRSIQDLGVGFHPHMVTMVAKKYGACRDMVGFMDWLTHCRNQGFALDPGFCNIVLYYCWAVWKLSFPELRLLHSKFEDLNPKCSNAVTQRILNQAAYRQGKRVSKEQYRVRFRAVNVNTMAFQGRTTNQRDILEAMNQFLTKEKPAAALSIYKRARLFGMPFCSHCHRLAVLAACRLRNAESTEAITLIQEAYDEGHDVQHAVAVFIKWQVHQFPGNAEDAVIHMRNLLARFESAQIVIGPSALTHMAALCVQLKEVTRAIALCHLARDRGGSPHLCYSVQSFKTLATAYSNLLDFTAMRSLVVDLSESQFSTEKTLLKHLKLIRSRVERMNSSDARTSFLEVVERGVQVITQTRLEARRHGKLVAEQALRIVGDALADMQKAELGGRDAHEAAPDHGRTRSPIYLTTSLGDVDTEMPRHSIAV